MSTEEEMYRRRLREFEPLSAWYNNNPAVHQAIRMYASGTILTREECLFRMVDSLCRNWDDVNRRNFELAMNAGIYERRKY